MSEDQPELFPGQPEIEPDHGYTKAGLPWWDNQPPTAWLKSNSRFSHRTEDGLRMTFRKRERKGRSPQWNAFMTRRGQRKAKKNYDTLSIYAGTSETFDLKKAARKMRAQLRKTEQENARVERGEIQPEDTSRPTEEEKQQTAVQEEKRQLEKIGQLQLNGKPVKANRAKSSRP